MTIKINQVDMVFDAVCFANEARAVISREGYELAIVAVVAGVSEAAVKDLLLGVQLNPKMQAFLGVCNALDLNPVYYFKLATLADINRPAF